MKTAFLFDNVLYEQCDGVSMRKSLVPVSAYVTLSEFKYLIAKPLIETGVLKFYCRYGVDTLVMIQKDTIQHILNSFNSFDKILGFIVDTFDNDNVQYLD